MKLNNCRFVLNSCVFPGWTTESQFTQQTWSFSRGSWSSTPRKCVTCSTWSSLWTQTPTSGCLAEVLVSPFRTHHSRTCHSMWTIKLNSPVVLRDMTRGRDLEQILTQYTTFVKPAFEEFCLPVSMLITNCTPTFQCLTPQTDLKQFGSPSDEEVCRCHNSKGSWQYG